LGFLNDIERLTRADAEAHYQRCLTPANILATVVGDVQASKVRDLAVTYFEKLPGGTKAGPISIVEPVQRTERRLIAPPGGPGGVMVGYHKGAVDGPTYPIWDVILPVLNKRMKAEIVERDKLAVRAEAHLGPAMKYPGIIMLFSFATPGTDVSKLEAALHLELERLKNEELTPEELAAVKPTGPGGEVGARSHDFALHLADWQSMTGDWRNLYRHPDRVRAVTSADVQKLARQTFDPSRRTVAIAPPTTK
jgi:predicted Zn-dependent peptidase